MKNRIPKELYEMTKLQISSYYKYQILYKELYDKAQMSRHKIDKGESKIHPSNEQSRLYEYLFVSEAIANYYKSIEKVIEEYKDREQVNKIIKHIAGHRVISLDKEYIKEFNKDIFNFIKRVIETSEGGKMILELDNKYFNESL